MKFKEVIKIIKEDGWYFVRQIGSHQQYHHEIKKGTVTVAGKSNDDIHPKTLKSI
ncbi:MAG: type II toxin-antitoxin system HicA family toxin [Ignavibacteria bacterium]|nr:type II toxin-antitoxin system HicA family toxin [Ignavibacteria bacterium]MBK7255051.1 type II toxin-antitoxin system HicA family toxin [Ignavibacteria bacterium]MBK8380974.1 type II toxin-antitoxin system HicA family toxin [Ignavibacteria bacterium]